MGAVHLEQAQAAAWNSEIVGELGGISVLHSQRHNGGLTFRWPSSGGRVLQLIATQVLAVFSSHLWHRLNLTNYNIFSWSVLITLGTVCAWCFGKKKKSPSSAKILATRYWCPCLFLMSLGAISLSITEKNWRHISETIDWVVFSDFWSDLTMWPMDWGRCSTHWGWSANLSVPVCHWDETGKSDTFLKTLELKEKKKATPNA